MIVLRTDQSTSRPLNGATIRLLSICFHCLSPSLTLLASGAPLSRGGISTSLLHKCTLRLSETSLTASRTSLFAICHYSRGFEPNITHHKAIAPSSRCPCTSDRFLPGLNVHGNHILDRSIGGDRRFSLEEWCIRRLRTSPPSLTASLLT